LGSPFGTLVANVVAFINNLRPDKKSKMLKLGSQVFSALTPFVKQALD
jgi:hypothetical protein